MPIIEIGSKTGEGDSQMDILDLETKRGAIAIWHACGHNAYRVDCAPCCALYAIQSARKELGFDHLKDVLPWQSEEVLSNPRSEGWTLSTQAEATEKRN